MLNIESPYTLSEYRNLELLPFNWTMTYRLDSDFPVPYAWIQQTIPLPAPIGSSLLKRYIQKYGQMSALNPDMNLAAKQGQFMFLKSQLPSRVMKYCFLKQC